MADRLVEIKGLSSGFRTEAGSLVAVENVSFSINRGETVCVLGESEAARAPLHSRS